MASHSASFYPLLIEMSDPVDGDNLPSLDDDAGSEHGAPVQALQVQDGRDIRRYQVKYRVSESVVKRRGRLQRGEGARCRAARPSGTQLSRLPASGRLAGSRPSSLQFPARNV